MRTKLFYLTSFLLSTVLVLFVLSSCDTGAVDSVISDTEMTQAETERESEIQPEDIVYHEEEFPVVYISTADGFQVTSKTEYTECNVRIELNDRYSAYTSTYTDEDGGGALIRCRGNMSYRLEDMKVKNKYSYKIKLDKKANVLGMGKSKHWILVNSWRDPGYQRNKASYDYSAMLGLDHVDSQWVSVYYNGEYRGVYLLCETIRVADDRIEMFNWEEFAEDIAEKYAEDHGFSDELEQLLSDGMEDNLEWITTYKYTFTYDGESEIIDLSKYYDKDKLDFTSGYLIESCQGALGSETVNWTTKHNVPISVDSPSRLTNPEMLDYVRTLIQDFEDALFSPTFYNAKGKHYSEYVDVDSMVDYWLVWNYFLNTEFSVRSLFFYIYDGKIIGGPCWDFDATAGSVMTMSAAKAKTDYWLHDRNSAWWLEIFGDPWFTSLCQERWYEMRELNDVF
ncbi:MAG: CotH kinase family protein, partial [Clostridia bacterium]|nr:CotH kinase family protein [Clostridia bacterium]